MCGKKFSFALVFVTAAVSTTLFATDGVFISLTRTVEPVDRQPANVSVITSEKIKNSGAQSAVELLRSEKGVTVRDYYGNGSKAEVDFRGFGETGASNNVVLVNGRRVNQIDIGNVDWTQIPVDLIERIEIIHGGAGVIYGDNATGGVINIITKTGTGVPPVETELSAGSFNLLKAAVSVNKSAKNFSYTARAGSFRSEGFRKNNSFNAVDFGVNSEYLFPGNASLTVGGSFHKDNYGLPGILKPQDWDSNEITKTYYPEDGARSVDYFLHPVFKTNLPEFGNSETEFSFRNRQVESDLVIWSLYDMRNIATIGASERFYRTDTLWGRTNKLLVGIEFYNSKQDITEYPTKERRSYTKKTSISRDSLGVFLDNRFSLTEDVAAVAGLRLESFNYNFKEEVYNKSDSSSLSAQAFNLDVNWFYAGNSSAKISLIRSFRTPKTDEYYTFDPQTYSVTGWNKNMKVQENSELSLNLRHFIRDSRNTLGVTLFQIDGTNEIFYNPSTGANENYSKTKRSGAELTADWLPVDFVKLNAGYSYTDAKFGDGTYNGKDIPAVPAHKANVSATFRVAKNIELTATDTYVSEQRFISDQNNSSGWLSSYNVLNSKIQLTLENLRIYAGINNLTDTKYTDYGLVSGANKYYYPAPGRNFVAGMSMSF
ncbi:MAG: TonB-dependent receptor [Elusimicrobiota bacterium]